MADQAYESGFKVDVRRCNHKVSFIISSFESVKVDVGDNGKYTFECTEPTELFSAQHLFHDGALGLLQMLIGGEPNREHSEGPDRHIETTILFPDEVDLEFWLNTEFLPTLGLADEDESPEERNREISKMARKIVVEVLGNKAKQDIMRQG